MVATFDKGHLGVSKINHWKSSGVDSIYTVQTQSGIILHANERHPFLVFNDGIMEWTRLKDLKAGMLLVATKAAIDLQGHKQSLTSVPLANQKKATIEKTLPLDTERHQKFLNELHRISDFTIDPIVSIIPSGQEEVFDVEVDRTENFIANGVVSHNTRWSKKDLTGQIIMNEARRGGDPWEVIEFPALMPSGKPLWPEFWSQKELEAIKTELPVGKWEAQYQQNPTSEEGAIIKRESWKIWREDYPPQCDYVIQSWDTAFEKNNRADFSACTTWGIFYQPNQNGDAIANIILLEAIKERLEFPELKTKAMQQFKEWDPDTLIVEKKAAGAPLIYEMRRMGIPISEYTPSKGSDKIARVNAISDLFASGLVWCPDTRWAEEVMEECASFPNGEHDDLVDSTSQALLRFRQGGFIRLETDEPDEPLTFKRKVVYY
jgi:predicted phage terminase large subunit-like protein